VLTVRLTRGRDAKDLLTCVRSDGSSTWTRLNPFFPVHDLTHLAVESTLGLDRAFYGLIAEGWHISTFAEPGASRRLPPEGVWTEMAVSAIQRFDTPGGPLSVEEVNDFIDAGMLDKPVGFARRITERELETILATVATLRGRWRALGPGESMEIQFVPGAPPAADVTVP